MKWVVRNVRLGTTDGVTYKTRLAATRAAAKRNRAEGWKSEGLRPGWGIQETATRGQKGNPS